MKKLINIFLSLAILLGTLTPLPTHAAESSGTVVTKTFTSTTTEFPNPERGWYKGAAYSGPSYFYLREFTSSSVADVYAGGFRNTIGILYMGDFLSGPLDSAFLTAFNSQMALVRAAGLKVILRPAYNYDSSGTDPPLSVALNHLTQLTPYFRSNADVIAYVEGGMIGSYGEQWGSANLCPDSAGVNASCRLAIANAELAAFDPRTMIMFRYPKHLMAIYPTALSKATRFNGSAQSRFGYYNDCFMSNTTDVGTYQSSVLTLANPERLRVATDTQWAPFMGETCGGFSPTRMACSDILSEGPTYHLTSLNFLYYTPFKDSWTSGGCIDQVTRSIGYRFQLDSAAMQSTATVGQSVTATINLRNIGWSRIFSARRLNLQLRNNSTGTTLVCIGDQDMRDLPPSATGSTEFAIRCNLGSLVAGTYTAYLAVPDVFSTTGADPRYSVRFGNADNTGITPIQQWDATNGRMSTGLQLVIS